MNKKQRIEIRTQVLNARKNLDLSIRDLAEVFEISTGTVWNWLRSAGTSRRKHITPDCHPDRAHYARGKCSTCYERGRTR